MQEARHAGASEGSIAIATSPAPTLRTGHLGILDDFAAGAPLADVLARIARLAEEEAPGSFASILVAEGDRLRLGAAPSLPDASRRALDGLPIRDGAASHGTSAATRRTLFVEDLRTHPSWQEQRALAAQLGLPACWSAPIIGRGGECLGALALHHPIPRGPTPQEERALAEAAHLASAAIEHDALLHRGSGRRLEGAQAAQLREFFKNAPIPISVVSGPDFVIEFVNAAYERLVSKPNIVGQRVRDAFPELEGQGLLELMRQICERGTPFEDPQMRVMFDRKGDGHLEEAYFNVRLEPMRDADGVVRGLVSVGFEVTDQVKARAQIDALRSDLGQREKLSALGQLVSGVAHEVRTPLTYLTTNLNLIQMRLDRLAVRLPREDAEAARMLTEQYVPSAIEAADRINHLVEDLRAYTQLKTGARERGSVRQVVAQAIDLFRVTHRGRVLVEHAAEGDAELEMDKLQLQQAILNLLQNALEAEPRDHTIRVRTNASPRRVTITVSDAGTGIPADAQPRIFDPFFTTRQGGTGLGLSIVKRIVDDHHGSISFQTSAAGTTFHLELPAEPRRVPTEG